MNYWCEYGCDKCCDSKERFWDGSKRRVVEIEGQCLDDLVRARDRGLRASERCW